MAASTWNEFNTFTKLIFPYLRENGYPSRESENFDEQSWVQKRGKKSGPYDGAFKDEYGVLLLVEAKREGLELGKKEVDQAFDYALGGTFQPLPPPYILVSNGNDHKWYRRVQNRDESFTYTPCEAVVWRKALEDRAGGTLTEELSLKKLIKLLAKVRVEVFNDLREHYFPNGYSFDKSTLGRRRAGYERILNTRKCFVDATLEGLKEEEANESVLSSIALSLTLKVLFVKIMTDLRSEPFPVNIRSMISELAADFPGILKAEPYDVLQFSDACEGTICQMMGPIRVSKALVFDADHNPIGVIWDGLVESEELDIQVKSLGNVYTPTAVVKAMVDAAERGLGSWNDRDVLEPACGSGHFVREVYGRMTKAYLAKSGNAKKLIEAHRAALTHLRAVDIDPFAVQTTQLGMFLELYRIPAVWQQIAPKGRFDFSRVVTAADFLSTDLFDPIQGFEPDLVIGNPPYGITVTPDIEARYGLGNNDSYGCFIVRAIESLKPAGHLIFVVSSSFLTTRTHRLLREKIFLSAHLQSVHVLHRNAFPGRDVFCCLLDVKRRTKERDEADGEYRFCDAWPIHPNSPEYAEALSAWGMGRDTKIAPELFGDYRIPERLVGLRLMPPSPKLVDELIKSGSKSVGGDFGGSRERVYPIFGGLPSLYLFCSDQVFANRIQVEQCEFPSVGRITGLATTRPCKKVSFVKLWQIAGVRQGLATADDEKFLRKTPGVVPNARRRNIKDVDLRCTVPIEELTKLAQNEKEHGIQVSDPQRDRYFVPFDKGGEQNTAGGELRAFWSPVDYWIDWSDRSVRLLRTRSKFPAGTPKKAVIRNGSYYFQQGIRFSSTGLYAPSFEVSFGAVFGHMGSLILPFERDTTHYLLTVLTSPLIRYLTKNFLQHSIHTEIDIIRQIPIAVPSQEEFVEINELAAKVIHTKESGESADALMAKAWGLVYRLYDIPKEDQQEIDVWFKRRYPNFGRDLRAPATS